MVSLGTNIGFETVNSELFTDELASLIVDPFGKTGADCSNPSFLLTAGRRYRFLTGS